MNLLGTFQPRLVAIHSVVLLSNGPELALHRPFIGLQMYSGRLDEHDWWYAILDTNFFLTDIKQFLLAHGYVALTNDMLKAYKVAQVWIFLSGWLQEAYFLKTKSNNNNLCILRTKCSPSQTLDDDHTMYRYCTKEDDGLIEGAYSSIIEMYWFIDTIVTTTFCHEFVRNISAKIGCNPFCYYLMVVNWHCIDTIEN
jgi:hypothetical protein